jgi:hypothetical protein
VVPANHSERMPILERFLDYLKDHFAVTSIIATGIILAKLFVLSGYDPVTAIQIAGSAGLFSLVIALVLSVFPIFVGSLGAALLLVAVDYRYRFRSLSIQFWVATAATLLAIVFLVPVTITNYAAISVSVILFVMSFLSRKTARKLTVVGIILVLALPLRAVLLDTRPWAQAQIYEVDQKQPGGTSGRTTIVGITITADESQTVILNYSPRVVFAVPSASITTSVVCALSGGSRNTPAIEILLRRTDLFASVSTSSPTCFPTD